MPLRPSSRLPKKLQRRVTKETRSLVGKRYGKRASFKKQRLKRTIRRGKTKASVWRTWLIRWSVVLITGVLVVTIALLLFSPLMHLREITVRRLQPRLDIEAVQLSLSDFFGRHLLFLARNEIENKLHSDIEDIATVDVSVVYPSKLVVTVGLNPLVARLHIVNPDDEKLPVSATGSVTDFLTAEGVYIVSTGQPETSELPLFRLVDWAIRPVPGTKIIPPDMLKSIQETEELLLKQFGKTVTIRSIYQRAQEYHLFTDGVSLWFDMQSPVADQLQRYKEFLESIPQNEVRQYIDLRIGDRIIYR